VRRCCCLAGANPSRSARERLALALSALAVLLTRLPWIGSGYGSDPDGYRVVIVARQIAHGGVYEASRLPGYPVYEYLTALTAWHAPWVSNAVTALFSTAAFVFFALIARELGVRRHLLIALALPDYQHYLAEGRDLYYLPGVDLYESQAHDLELGELGARPLAVPRELQRAQSSGE